MVLEPAISPAPQVEAVTQDLNQLELHNAISDSKSRIDNWWPRSLRTIMNGLEDMEVVMMSSVSRTTVRDELTLAIDIGLTIIAETIDTPKVVALTTIDKIYVFHMLEQGWDKYAKFLAKQLRRTDLKFYTVNGDINGYILFKYLNIKLQDQVDLENFDIHYQMSKEFSKSPAPNANAAYSITDIVQKLKVRRRDLQQLVSKWLDLDTNLEMSVQEWCSIETLPFDQHALNAIKKRSAMVRALGLTILQKYCELRDQPSKDIYSLGVRATNELKEQYDRTADSSYSDLCHFLNQCASTNCESL